MMNKIQDTAAKFADVATSGQIYDLMDHLNNGRKIQAIKVVREATGVGL
ncbi:hypothetical protein [Streptomyces sp. NPDC059009]